MTLDIHEVRYPAGVWQLELEVVRLIYRKLRREGYPFSYSTTTHTMTELRGRTVNW